MSRAQTLFRLQGIDSQIDIVRQKLSELEKAIEDDSELAAAQIHFHQANDTLISQNKLARKAEEAAVDQRIKIEQTEAALYGGKVKNPKELQDLQKDLASLKRYMATLEDRQLELMISVEEAENARADAKARVDKAMAAYAERTASLRGEQTGYLAKMERLEVEKKAAAAAIPAEEAQLYEQLRKLRKGVAVAQVSGKACSACGTTLTAALIQSIQSTAQLVRCPTCGRIIYAA